jgi:hypothetical protein
VVEWVVGMEATATMAESRMRHAAAATAVVDPAADSWEDKRGGGGGE